MIGDLWDYVTPGSPHKIVISTNIGWHLDTCRNNMGAGIALQCAQRYPGIDVWYGRMCSQLGASTPVLEHPTLPLIFLPVKGLLNPNNPERSWDQPASPSLVRRGLKQLLAVEGPIALSYPGAGNGKLLPRQVRDMLYEELRHDWCPARFTIVEWCEEPREMPF